MHMRRRLASFPHKLARQNRLHFGAAHFETGRSFSPLFYSTKRRKENNVKARGCRRQGSRKRPLDTQTFRSRRSGATCLRRPSCVGDTVHKVGCRDSGRLCDPVPCARVARAASTRRCAGARRWCRQRTWCPRAAGRWRRATRVPGRTVTANVRRKHPPLIASKALWRALLRRCSGFFGSCREQRAE